MSRAPTATPSARGQLPLRPLQSDSIACCSQSWCSEPSSSWLSPAHPHTTPGARIDIRSTQLSARSTPSRTPSPSKPHGHWRRSIFSCWIQRNPIAAIASRPSESMRRSRFASPRCRRVRRIAIIDAQGNRRHGSGGFPAGNLNLADRSYFTTQRDNAAVGLFMSEPLVSRADGRAVVILSRRVDDERGNFAGVVTATVDLDDLNQFYRAVNVGAGGVIQLVRDDGTLLVRNPAMRDAVGRMFPTLAAPAVAGDFFKSDRRSAGVRRGRTRPGHSPRARSHPRCGGRAATVARRDDSGRHPHVFNCPARRAHHRSAGAPNTAGGGQRAGAAPKRRALCARDGRGK